MRADLTLEIKDILAIKLDTYQMSQGAETLQIDTVWKAGPCIVTRVIFGPNIPIISLVKGAQVQKKGQK